ncbi:MAG: hypothetical protein LH606_02190 [Cytophagaceae bacterium]|nr:hypothetical protein [Cytophagaceae bacterium]
MTLVLTATGQNKGSASPVNTDAQRATRTVLHFLNWYKNHIDSASRIYLVNQPPGKNYSVNFKNGERYLAYLKSSRFLTDVYLNEWRTFFKERDEGFRLSPQNEGPPTGFEYDLVLLSQNVDLQLGSLNALKINKVRVRSNRASVQFSLLGEYEFQLVKQNNRWVINEILNLGAE